VFEAVDEVWRSVGAERVVEPKQRAAAHLACSHAVGASVKAVERVHAAAGSAADFTSHPRASPSATSSATAIFAFKPDLVGSIASMLLGQPQGLVSWKSVTHGHAHARVRGSPPASLPSRVHARN
jgi:hypothetical protein